MTDGRVERYADLASRILASEPRLGPVRLVAVDGPAGSGKTTFARRLAAALRRRISGGGSSTDSGAAGVGEVHTDDLLEGWTDLESFWPRLQEQILVPLRRAGSARFQTYDWVRERFRDEPTVLAVPAVLIVEGVSSARAAGDAYRSLSVYVHADRALRLARGIERDGEALRPQWQRWMAAEEAHFAREHTAARADLLVAGASAIPHDPEQEYVRG